MCEYQMANTPKSSQVHHDLWCQAQKAAALCKCQQWRRSSHIQFDYQECPETDMQHMRQQGNGTLALSTTSEGKQCRQDQLQLAKTKKAQSTTIPYLLQLQMSECQKVQSDQVEGQLQLQAPLQQQVTKLWPLSAAMALKPCYHICLPLASPIMPNIVENHLQVFESWIKHESKHIVHLSCIKCASKAQKWSKHSHHFTCHPLI